METALMRKPSSCSGEKNRKPRIARRNVTMPVDLIDLGEQRAAALKFPSFSAYLQNFVRIDVGLGVTTVRQ